MNKSKIAIGALVGAAAGIIAGMLTAPKSGKASRADLRYTAKQLRDEAKHTVEKRRGKKK